MDTQLPAGPARYREVAPHAPEGAIDLDQLLPGRDTLELEIGFGRGMFLLQRARQHPEIGVVGYEIRRKWAYIVAQRCEREGLEGVRVFAGEARELLARTGPAGRLARCFLHFPDPWWKKRHAKRRVFSEALADRIGWLLAPGGELFVQTDVQDRAQEYVRLLDRHAAFALVEEDGLVAANPYGAQSNREARAEQDGLPIHRILARRI